MCVCSWLTLNQGLWRFSWSESMHFPFGLIQSNLHFLLFILFNLLFCVCIQLAEFKPRSLALLLRWKYEFPYPLGLILCYFHFFLFQFYFSCVYLLGGDEAKHDIEWITHNVSPHTSATTIHFRGSTFFVGFYEFLFLVCWCTAIQYHQPRGPSSDSLWDETLNRGPLVASLEATVWISLPLGLI